MMTVDEKRYLVVARRAGRTLEVRAVTGTHLLPGAMSDLALKHPNICLDLITLRPLHPAFESWEQEFARVVAGAILVTGGGT